MKNLFRKTADKDAVKKIAFVHHKGGTVKITSYFCRTKSKKQVDTCL
jgi:hypothetical protein